MTRNWYSNPPSPKNKKKTKKGKENVFLPSSRGGKTLEKLDTLNYTNTQCKALIQSVWTTNTDWKSLDLCHYVKCSCWCNTRKLEKCLQSFTILSVKNTSTQWCAKYKALILSIHTVDMYFDEQFYINTSHTRRAICHWIIRIEPDKLLHPYLKRIISSNSYWYTK